MEATIMPRRHQDDDKPPIDPAVERWLFRLFEAVAVAVLVSWAVKTSSTPGEIKSQMAQIQTTQAVQAENIKTLTLAVADLSVDMKHHLERSR